MTSGDIISIFIIFTIIVGCLLVIAAASIAKAVNQNVRHAGFIAAILYIIKGVIRK